MAQDELTLDQQAALAETLAEFRLTTNQTQRKIDTFLLELKEKKQMGYTRHHAIVVTSFDKPSIEAAHQQALAIFKEEYACMVSSVNESPVNRWWSFAIFPDGSKEGWTASDRGNHYRASFVEWLKEPQDQFFWDWVEVQYGDDAKQTMIIDDSDADTR